MLSRFLAGLMSAALLLSANAVAAQDAGTLNETESGLDLDQGAALLAVVTSNVNGLLDTLGYEASPTMAGFTAEMFAASIPYTTNPDVLGTTYIALGFNIQPLEASTDPEEHKLEFGTDVPSGLSDEEERFAATQGYVLFNDATECQPADGAGRVAAFRRLTSDSAQGHLCVVVTQDDATGIWQVQTRGVAVAGERRARSYYAIRVSVEENSDKARLLGEPHLDAIIEVGSVMAKYTMAIAALDNQDFSAEEAIAAWQKFEEVIRRETKKWEQPEEAGYEGSPERASSQFRASVIDSLSRLTETLGLDVPDLTVGLTAPMVQSSFAGRWIDGLKGSDFTPQYRAWIRSEATPERPQDFTVLPDETSCLANIGPDGKMVYFRKLARDGVAEGHQCVGAWTRDNGETWALTSHSVSVAGDTAVLSTYHMKITGEAGTDAARLFGEEGQDRMTALAVTLAHYGMAANVARFQVQASETPEEAAQVIAHLRQGLAASVIPLHLLGS